MGHIPHFHDTIFPAPSLPFLNLVSNIGLVLFLFLVGLELDPKLVLQRARRALGISIAGIALPFGLGAAVSLLLYRELEGPEAAGPSIGVFILFCGVAMSITAFAVLARILAANHNMKLLGTTVGFLVVCAGALGDIVAWILLALVVSIINSASPITPLYVVLLAIGWCLILVFAVLPLLLYLVRITHSEEEPSQAMIAITVLVVLVSAFVTDIIGIHAIFGGFLVGLLIPHDSGFAEGMTRRLEDLIGVIFLPIYFALSGLKTRIGLLDNAEAWGLVVLVTMVACAGKIAGCSAAAMLNGMTWRESLAIGFLMNCKGLVELIVLNIGYDAGVINDKVFVIMVAMCLLTTMMATPFVRLVFPVSYQKELEAKRARELQEMEYDGMGDGDLPTSDEKKATHLYPDIRQRKGGVGSTASTITYARSEKNSLRRHVIAQVDHGGLLSDMTVRDVSHVPRREGIMLCLDKTANAPSVMALLQLFASSAAQNAMSHSTSFQQDMSQHQRTRSNQYIPDPHAASFLQPPVPSFDSDSEYVDSHSTHHRRAHGLRSDPQPTPPVFALRILSISERTTSVMLTASRCLDRLYKDTVMMMVMAFSKLNSIPVQPLVTLSTNVASPDVVDDILDRADEHGAACIIFPWNSSHLADLGSSDRPPGATWSHSATTVPLSVQPTNTSAAPTEQQRSHHAVPFRHRVYTNTSETSVPEYGLHRGPRHLHEFFHWPQRFDHDEAHRVTAGRHTDLSESGRHHRTSVTSNTKVLSKLLQLCPQHQIATGALVDRGLGLFGGVRHIVVPLFGGRDDEEALTMAGSLATNRGAKCFVTVVRVAEQLLPPLSPLNRPTSTIESSSLRPRHWKSPSASIDPHIPVVRSATPDLSVRGFDDGSSEAVPSKLGARVFSGESLVSVDMRIPKNDEELL
ncbi:K(+)/H(+) antiporter, partial [Actinomortierella ambigua]